MQSASFGRCCVNMAGECLDRQTSHTLHSDTEVYYTSKAAHKIESQVY